jgi:hypothetical protein
LALALPLEEEAFAKGGHPSRTTKNKLVHLQELTLEL